MFLHIYACLGGCVTSTPGIRWVTSIPPDTTPNELLAYFSNFLCDVVLGSSSSWDLDAFVWGWLLFKHGKSISENTNLGDGSRVLVYFQKFLPWWTGRRSRVMRSATVNAFSRCRSTVTPNVVRGTTFGADFGVRRFLSFVRYVSVHCMAAIAVFDFLETFIFE